MTMRIKIALMILLICAGATGCGSGLTPVEQQIQEESMVQ